MNHLFERKHVDVKDFHGYLIEIRRKKIKNLYIRIPPHNGVIKVSIPLMLNEKVLLAWLEEKLPWIKKHVDRQQARSTDSKQYVDGEMHPFLGDNYVLRIHEGVRPYGVMLNSNSHSLVLRVGANIGKSHRKKILDRWYRKELSLRIPVLISKWEKLIGVSVSEWKVRRMTTRWGSCNITAKRVWLNFELIKMPPHCLEYVIVHEMVHLLERYHNARFYAYLDRFYPSWRLCRIDLEKASIR